MGNREKGTGHWGIEMDFLRSFHRKKVQAALSELQGLNMAKKEDAENEDQAT